MQILHPKVLLLSDHDLLRINLDYVFVSSTANLKSLLMQKLKHLLQMLSYNFALFDK